jgi:hypothetical protein
MSARSSSWQPSTYCGRPYLLSKAEIGQIEELATRGSPSTLASPELRQEALRIARRLVDGKPVSRNDTCLDAVWEAVWFSAKGVAGGRHSEMLKRSSSRKMAARWLADVHSRIEDAFPDRGAL